MANHLKHCAQVSYKSLKTWWRQCNWDNLWKDGRIDTGMVCWTDRLTDATQLQKLKPAGWYELKIREYVPLHWQNSHFNTTWHLKRILKKYLHQSGTLSYMKSVMSHRPNLLEQSLHFLIILSVVRPWLSLNYGT